MDLTPYRPRDATSAAVRDAIAATRAATAPCLARVDEAKEQRDALLLDGTPKQVDAATTTLRAVHDEAEQLEAISDQLEARLAVALKEETCNAVVAALAKVGAGNERANTFWATHGPTLTALMTESDQIARELLSAWYLVKSTRKRASEKYGDDPRVGGDSGVASLDPAVEKWQRLFKNALAPG